MVPSAVTAHDGTLPVAIAAHGCRLLVPPAAGYLQAKINTGFAYGDSLAITVTFSPGGAVDVQVPMAPPGLTVTAPLGQEAGPDLCTNPE